MEFFSLDFFVALGSIIIIDLLLAGDNVIVIGLAARNLPQDQQKKAIIWGSIGAIVIRVIATVVVVQLLKIPGLLLVGGLILLWIAYKLLVEEDKEVEVESAATMFAAVRTIIVADVVMGLDNVIAIAGASRGSMLLVILGLIISVPFIVWGSSIFLKFLQKYPILLYVGSGVLAYTASDMMTKEKFIQPLFLEWWVDLIFSAVLIILVLWLGYWQKQKKGDAALVNKAK